MSCSKYLTLSGELNLPVVGLGTWRAPDAEVELAIEEALTAGYRHFDCAPAYGNEKVIGCVFKRWLDNGKMLRSELWVTTKLPPNGNRASSVEKHLSQSLVDLQLDFLDLYLIHTPVAVPDAVPFLRNEDGDVVLDTEADLVETWKEMEKMVEKGLTKTIGISNFNQKQIQRILDNCSIKPACLQIEMHLYLQQKELLKFCHANQILVMAYSPLGSRGIEKLYPDRKDLPNLFENEEVIELSGKYQKTPAQILLRFLIQQNVAVIPKSTNPQRLRENLDIFDFVLKQDEMEKLFALDKNIRVCDLNFFPGFNKHPEYPW